MYRLFASRLITLNYNSLQVVIFLSSLEPYNCFQKKKLTLAVHNPTGVDM